ncbi:MAG: hypothetical protein AABW59_00845 [archaeon]
MLRQKGIVFLISSIFCLFLIFGCTSPGEFEYFEIVQDKQGYFHEVIILNTGQVMEKTGPSNLSFENSVRNARISPEKAKLLIQDANSLIQKGSACEYGEKEIIFYSGGVLSKTCFNSAEFDSLFLDVTSSIASEYSVDNFFVHLVYAGRNGMNDYHLFNDGLVLENDYSLGGELSSVSFKKIESVLLENLKNSATGSMFENDNNCSLETSGYRYVEIQKGQSYNYYVYCDEISQSKKDFYDGVLKALGEAK